MTAMWPWIAVAGLGALHGLSPTTGWMFAAACGVRAHDGNEVRRALVPIGIGHAASVAVVASVMALGCSIDRGLVQSLAGALLVGAALHRLLGKPALRAPVRTRTSHMGIALWSFLAATTHGAGMMLVPALVPLCFADNPAREITATGSLLLALAAVCVHTAAMLVTTGVVAAGIQRCFSRYARRLNGNAPGRIWTGMLALTGALLMAVR